MVEYNALIVPWKCNFPSYSDIMTDLPSNRATNQQTDIRGSCNSNNTPKTKHGHHNNTRNCYQYLSLFQSTFKEFSFSNVLQPENSFF